MRPTSHFDREPARKLLAAVFVVLMAMFGFVQAVHVHDGLAGDESPNSPAPHCLICVAAHSAPAVTVISFTPVLELTATVAPVLNPQLLPQLVIPSVFIRPPPPVL